MIGFSEVHLQQDAPFAPCGYDALVIPGKGVRMAVEYFTDDTAFRRWLGEHPDGYVLNYYTTATGKMHTARCKSYQVAGRRMTSRVKACSTSKRDLFGHAKQKRIAATSCGLCM